MNWRQVRVETVVVETRETIDPQSLDCPLVSHYSIPSLEATGLPELVPPEEILSAKQVLRGGEVMLSRLNPRKARVLRVPEKLDQPTIASGEFVIMQPSGVDGDFLKYTLLSEEVRQHLHSCVQSVTRSHQRIRPEHLLKMPLRVPDFETQVAIRDYVSRETARIDELIAMQQLLIARLDEYRTALITRAVTKGLPPDAAEMAGLDPTPKMKDSGVVWLGEVPGHWQVLQLRRALMEPLAYGANEPADIDDPLYPRYVRITDIDARGSLHPDTFRSLPPDIAAQYLLTEGDLLFARSGATVGKTFLYRSDWGPCAYAGYLIRARFDAEMADVRFVRYFTSSSTYWAWLASAFIQATIQNVSAERYAGLEISLPPVDEQQAIVQYLDAETELIDQLRTKAELSIERLEEYRSAVISAAVTGKLDVRDEALVGAGGGG